MKRTVLIILAAISVMANIAMMFYIINYKVPTDKSAFTRYINLSKTSPRSIDKTKEDNPIAYLGYYYMAM